MFRKLMQFEWHYNTRSLLFYVPFLVYLVFGFMLGCVVNSTFPGLYRNSPYMIAYFIGLFSMNTVFSTTVFVAQSFLREGETKFDSILYATPVTKANYLGSRFTMAFLINCFSYMMFAVGLVIGHLMPWMPKEELQPLSLFNYIWPFVTIALPNILLCTAILTAFAWLSKNKLMIYVGGIFVFILYTICSIFSNSPVFAGVSPASAESMALVARLDPFGLAAFFEQTRYWTAFQKNSQLLMLSGNFLFNRLLWIGISSALVLASYRLFSFRKMKAKKVRQPKKSENLQAVSKFSRLQNTEFQTVKHNLEVLKSFLKIDIALIVKGIPFAVLVILLVGVLSIEIKDEINGGIRMAESLATTGLMVTTIMDRLPVLLILIMLFYGSELLWRSESARFGMLENVTPYNQSIVLISKLISLWMVPFLLLVISMIIGLGFQIVKGNAPIEWNLYLSLFYYIGVPMLLASILILAIQSLFKNRYVGLTIATVVTLLFCTGVGNMLDINHPLLRFADTLKIEYFDLNGFGKYRFSFLAKILYNLGFALILLFLSGIWRKNSNFSFKKALKLSDSGFLQKGILVLGGLFFMGFGSYIFYETNVKSSYATKEGQQDWSQQYEEKFRKFEELPQPTISSVKTNVDLFPENNSYKVTGCYRLVNNSEKPIDSLLLYIDENITLSSVAIPNSKLIKNEAVFGHYWYKLNVPLQPKQAMNMTYSFTSEWSPFKGHTPFNSIIDNGSFMRMSKYYPRFGYQAGNEIDNEKVRNERGMAALRPLKKLEDDVISPYDFIDFEAVVSTSKDQTAIGSGELIKQWEAEGRNYFHYKCDRKIPFRFAFSSAEYEIRKERYNGISIEIYYDKRHARNIDELLRATKSTLDYCEGNFGKYPYKVIRYAEISAFAEGFAATAYPGTIYMKENFGFNGDISRGDKEDVINQLAGHELSHQWWGNEKLSPEEKEGGWIMTETLAQYTELMLYEKRHGRERALETVKVHLDLYLSNRSFGAEMPLYKTHYDTPHLPYNKGMVIMHQLRLLIGEANVNKALKAVLTNYAFPSKPADTRDLLREIYKVTPVGQHSKIDEMFKQVVTYTSKIESVSSRKISEKKFEVSFDVSTSKFRENSKGKQTLIANDTTIDIGIYDENGKLSVQSFPINKNRSRGKIVVSRKPFAIIIDPNLKNIDTFPEDNEKDISSN